MKLPRRLIGMQDHGPSTLFGFNRVSNRLELFLSAHGYMQIDVPVLEETELFLRKSGGELASKMYTFLIRVATRLVFAQSSLPRW